MSIVNWWLAPKEAEFYHGGDFYFKRGETLFLFRDGEWVESPVPSCDLPNSSDFELRPVCTIKTTYDEFKKREGEMTDHYAQQREADENKCCYEYGVEYPTNGQKPDLPDDVLVEVKINNGIFKNEYCADARAVGWSVWDERAVAFRIVDDRYKPKTPVTAQEAPKPQGPYQRTIIALDGSKCVTDADLVNHPKHYAIAPGVEAIDIIKASLTPEQFKGYLLGNFLKYRLRAGDKDDLQQDIAKSNWYRERLNEN